MLRTGRILISLAVTAALIGAGVASAGAHRRHAGYKPCGHQRLAVGGTTGGSLPVTHLRVHAISCARAQAALRAATYEATPGGPLFSTPGFTCTGPVGPPLPGQRPRYYHCTHRHQAFEFLVPGFS